MHPDRVFTAIADKPFALTCVVISNPHNYTIEWYKLDEKSKGGLQPTKPNKKFAIEHNDLIIKKTKLADSGDYVCKTYYKKESNRAFKVTFHVNVEKKLVLNSSAQKRSLIRGQHNDLITLNCSVTGADDFTWLFNGYKISNQNDMAKYRFVEKNLMGQTLSFNADSSYSGFYQCYATNKNDAKIKTFVVDIESVEKKEIPNYEIMNYVFHIAVIHLSSLYFVFTVTFILMFKMYMFPGQRRIETSDSTTV